MKIKSLIPLLLILFQIASIAQNSVFNYIEISGNLPSDIRPVSNPVNAYVYTKAIDLSVLDVQNKKQAFINIMLPSILLAKHQLEEDRNKVLALEKKREPLSDEEERYLVNLKKDYKCHTSKELLLRLSTHPTSIVLAQAAIESGWGTSRFYKEANNVFGVWSYNENEPRIKAMEDREGKSIYVRKYDVLSESIISYFKTIARGPYSEFRTAREKISDVSILISYLKVYSELREEYVKRLSQLIQYNKFEKYDSYRLKMSNE